MLPNFFVIGAIKSGTTSLNRYLGLHPETHMSPRTQTNFFVDPAESLSPVPLRISSRAEYERLFDCEAQVRGEVSPGYSHFPHRRGVPERIKEFVPDAKFIYLVRDPIDRIVSQYRHAHSWGDERRTLEESLGDIRRPENLYICASRYATQLERYLRLFPEDRMLVIDQANLLDARAETLREAFEFLGVDPDYTSPDYEPEFNVSNQTRVYPRFYSRLRHRGPLRRLPDPLRLRLKQMAERSERVLWRPSAKPHVSEYLRQRLANLFVDEMDRLRSMTGQDFASWSL